MSGGKEGKLMGVDGRSSIGGDLTWWDRGKGERAMGTVNMDRLVKMDD